MGRTTAGFRYSDEQREAITAKRRTPLVATRTGRVVRFHAEPAQPRRSLDELAARCGLSLVNGKVG